MNDRFNVHVNSGAQSDIFPDNNPSNFTNQMPVTIDLPGTGWSVGIRSITYENTWKSFEKDAIFTILAIIDTNAGPLRSLPLPATGKPIMKAGKQVTGQIVMPTPIGLNSYHRYLTGEEKSAHPAHLKIPAGVYDRPQSIVLIFAKTINDYFDSLSNWDTRDKLIYGAYDKNSDRAYFQTFDPGYEVIFYEEHETLANMLGFPRVKADYAGTGYWMYRLDKGTTFSAKPPSSFPIRSLYIYSPIIENEVVGGVYTPLLQRISVSANYGEQGHERFNEIDFKPLRLGLTALSDIQIDIRDVTGTSIKFERGITDVQLVFRRMGWV